ncbi:hypothetical protein A3H10_04700 [Candidatus Uhrbacteria bacterium RIFCSPLOWO2_12_FULL_46_10]|uniref:Uncharacterized protein n=1 Tax=Candidatus Uhrbacteria bacterium RIFCSPLOWO2_01_FULL_47_25 TaxID=1802402 RepID=A0A1F7UX61_9BACT|nr:MAG: hypothetical protein UX68_C0006G0043 [Parcubacteria group bacterium GW2011_GWA2_46_9]OGL69459.1 MAG: hypothetical protein A3D60_03240 [Candidatus Uhrbacteria bacterium RIFCSPHIGHO2_02_FULL_47_29]OGL82865.1 MAG: hypothetical protein A2936_04340 [Candidatus Uhrbacteria bacterium RIFCSPLOWO2_01_FULL_47_25]OGL85892.1 MAG: hypothetical protein A3I37_00870 [Candidatus Uhrbacteria bacterium RIFCSPLOWO2_02_FULL_46_19]OGL91059.1 MAG: hypothetical protein A3H10_04700 [Candidatus Uhrbacteria bacte
MKPARKETKKGRVVRRAMSEADIRDFSWQLLWLFRGQQKLRGYSDGCLCTICQDAMRDAVRELLVGGGFTVRKHIRRSGH